MNVTYRMKQKRVRSSFHHMASKTIMYILLYNGIT